jgi:tetratricopeptide (TPR) repeat protein
MIHSNRGLVYYHKKEFELAKDLIFSIEHQPDRAVTYDFRGCCYRELDEFDKALADFNAAIELDSQDPIIIINRGLLFEKMKELEKTLSDFNQAIKLYSNYKEVSINKDRVQTILKEKSL